MWDMLKSALTGTRFTKRKKKDAQDFFEDICRLELTISELNNEISDYERQRAQLELSLDFAHIMYTNLSIKGDNNNGN